MRVSKWLMTAVVASAAGCAQPTPEQRIVNEAAQALGGRDRVLNVKTIALEGEGRQFNLGQDMRPDAADQTFTVSGFTRRQDLAANRSRTELTRTPTFAYFQGQAPQRQIQGIDGDVAYNIAANNTAARVATPVASDRKADLLHHPVAIVRAAASPGATVTNARTAGAERLVDITADGRQFVLAVDSTGLPVRVESKSDNPNLGDVILSTHFADYQDVNGVKMPARDHDQRGRLHDRGVPFHQADHRRGHRRSRGPGSGRVGASRRPDHRRPTSFPSRWRRGSGCSPGSRTTACSSR